MKNQNIVFIAIAFALAFALAPVTNAAPSPGGIPTASAAANQQPSAEGEQMPLITIHSAGNILRGETGSFVLEMKPVPMFGGMYVNFSVSGTAIPGVDYVALVSPAYIGPSGYAVLLIKALPDPRGPADRQSYSVEVKLDSGLGYALGQPSSAMMWIKP